MFPEPLPGKPKALWLLLRTSSQRTSHAPPTGMYHSANPSVGDERCLHIFGEQRFPTRPCLVASLFVLRGASRVLAQPHKGVAGTVVGNRLVDLARRLHLRNGIGDGGIDTRIIAAVKTVYGRLDARH